MTSAICHGAASIIAAFATGRGAAFGTGLSTTATVELTGGRGITASIGGNSREDTKLMKLCVGNTLKHFGFSSGASVRTESDIPIAAGLKSSSVAANAVVLATAGALAERHGEIREVRLSKTERRQELYINGRLVPPLELINIGVDSALQAKVTVTGAFDDATASYFGGYTITNNRRREILRSGDMESLDVLILLPEKRRIYTVKADLSNIGAIRSGVNAAWNLALEGDLYTAITMNGLLHAVAFKQDAQIPIAALNAGAIAAALSGKGPAVVALARGNASKIKKALSRFGGKIIETRTNNTPARIISK
ncbi:MAG: shikimate kinase [Candidatus Altiarchaeota archaeon]|nr:shikimate kinase [Candidatus Altiarchaeota archaeon]